MIKKISNYLFVFILTYFISLSIVSAKELSLSDLAKEVLEKEPNATSIFIIGQHVFTSEHLLTTQDTMLAARTIKTSVSSNGNEIYDDMTIAYFEGIYDSDWNVIGFEFYQNVVGKSLAQDIYDICYVDYNYICGESSSNKFTVTWKNYDGTVLETDTDVIEGTAPSYDGITPSRIADETYTYEFIGWTPDLTMDSIVNGNITYVAKYKKTYIEYTITFKNDDGSELSKKKYHYGDIVVLPTNPIKEATDEYVYEFTSWDKSVTSVVGDETYTAKYEQKPIIKVDVEKVLKESYEVIKLNAATDKFDVSLINNTLDVTINDLTINSLDALEKTGVATAITNFLNTEGIKSVSLQSGSNTLVISRDDIDAIKLYNFLVNVSGNGENALALNDKEIIVNVTFEELYRSANINTFNIKFCAELFGYVDVDSLLGEAYEVIKLNAATDKFDITVNENEVTVILVDKTIDSFEALQRTGVATAITNFLNDDGVRSLTLTSGSNTITLFKDSVEATELYNFLTSIAGENSQTAADLIGKNINVTVNLKSGYLPSNYQNFTINFTEITPSSLKVMMNSLLKI